MNYTRKTEEIVSTLNFLPYLMGIKGQGRWPLVLVLFRSIHSNVQSKRILAEEKEIPDISGNSQAVFLKSITPNV